MEHTLTEDEENVLRLMASGDSANRTLARQLITLCGSKMPDFLERIGLKSLNSSDFDSRRPIHFEYCYYNQRLRYVTASINGNNSAFLESAKKIHTLDCFYFFAQPKNFEEFAKSMDGFFNHFPKIDRVCFNELYLKNWDFLKTIDRDKEINAMFFYKTNVDFSCIAHLNGLQQLCISKPANHITLSFAERTKPFPFLKVCKGAFDLQDLNVEFGRIGISECLLTVENIVQLSCAKKIESLFLEHVSLNETLDFSQLLNVEHLSISLHPKDLACYYIRKSLRSLNWFRGNRLHIEVSRDGQYRALYRRELLQLDLHSAIIEKFGLAAK